MDWHIIGGILCNEDGEPLKRSNKCTQCNGPLTTGRWVWCTQCLPERTPAPVLQIVKNTQEEK